VTEDERVTQREAAQLLGVHISLIPKMVRPGDLAPRDARPSLSRQILLECSRAIPTTHVPSVNLHPAAVVALASRPWEEGSSSRGGRGELSHLCGQQTPAD
jgi:hypothetical protein